jgi:two-component system, OmpR family, phosphate regulon response regulator PhoB
VLHTQRQPVDSGLEAATASGNMQPAARRPCVLFVDDCAAERDMYVFAVEKEVDVLTASCGDEAIEIAATEHPDAIVLDVWMPRMDGRRVCRRLKADHATADIPVIMLTGDESAGVVTESLRAGAANVLTKPCGVDKLVLTIFSTLGWPRPRLAW